MSLIVATAFFAGVFHVVSGPDHLAAVAPLAVRAHRRAWATGLKWGIGHALGVALVGVGSLALRELLPVDAISAWSERLVGVLLVGIGIWGLHRAFQFHLHAHHHTHDGKPHWHFHVHWRGHSHDSGTPHEHSHAALGVGTLHGLAGSSHFLALLPALGLPTRAHAISYVAAYGVGTVLAMVGAALAIGWMASRASGLGSQGYNRMMAACACIAVVTGCFWLLG